MHKANAVLIIAMALLLAAPCTALAGKKKVDTPRESLSLNYGKIKYEYRQQRPDNPTTGSAIKSNARR
jgi:type VI protein secretion system component Hcp